MATFTVKLKSDPLRLVVWDIEASRAVGELLAEEIRKQARQESSGVAGAFPLNSRGQRVTLTRTGKMLDTLHNAEVTAERVVVESKADYSPFVDALYPHMGFSTATEIAVLKMVERESSRAFERARDSSDGRIAVEPQGRGRDRGGN